LRQSGYGCALMSPRPSAAGSLFALDCTIERRMEIRTRYLQLSIAYV
jgi:hypothetical protein